MPRVVWKSADNSRAVEEEDGKLFFVWRAPIENVFALLPNPLDYRMTKREQEVFRNVLRGLQDKEIAELLNISTRAVKFHNTNIYGKLGVSGRRELFAMKQKEGSAT